MRASSVARECRSASAATATRTARAAGARSPREPGLPTGVVLAHQAHPQRGVPRGQYGDGLLDRGESGAGREGEQHGLGERGGVPDLFAPPVHHRGEGQPSGPGVLLLRGVALGRTGQHGQPGRSAYGEHVVRREDQTGRTGPRGQLDRHDAVAAEAEEVVVRTGLSDVQEPPRRVRTGPPRAPTREAGRCPRSGRRARAARPGRACRATTTAARPAPPPRPGPWPRAAARRRAAAARPRRPTLPARAPRTPPAVRSRPGRAVRRPPPVPRRGVR